MTADMPPDPGAIAEVFGLAGAVGAFDPVGGAWSNRVYRLVAGSEAYAVKEMRNPWNIAHWREWLEEAWAFELRSIRAGVAAPEPVPNPGDGGCLASVERAGGGTCEVRVHGWVDGEPAPLGPAARAIARWAGETLATMHRLQVRPMNRAVFPTVNTVNAQRWPALWEAAARAGVSWAGGVGDVAAVVAEIARLAETPGRIVNAR